MIESDHKVPLNEKLDQIHRETLRQNLGESRPMNLVTKHHLVIMRL